MNQSIGKLLKAWPRISSLLQNPARGGIPLIAIHPIKKVIDKISGKDLSYNNLLDIDAAINLMSEFINEKSSFGIFKHTNACGFATRSNTKKAYIDSLAGDPISAFGGILISNSEIDLETADEINSLFFEILIAPSFSEKAKNKLLEVKKNRVLILLKKNFSLPKKIFRSCLNGSIQQTRDNHTDSIEDLDYVTNLKPSKNQIEDLLFGSKISKHTKSNTIVLVKNKQLLGSGTGQTSRVDALRHAIEKSKKFNFNLKDAVMISDAFFPFPDCVEIAQKEGINSIIQVPEISEKSFPKLATESLEKIKRQASAQLSSTEDNTHIELLNGDESIHFLHKLLPDEAEGDVYFDLEGFPFYDFRKLVYTSKAYTVKLNVNNDSFDAIIQDIQFHPVSGKILHIDFYELTENKEISISIPVEIKGSAPGVLISGGVLIINKRK